MENSAKVELKATKGPQAGKTFAFDRHDVFLFGRAADCHCSIPDDHYISSHHFLLEVNPPECELRDLGSKNGTFVNGVPAGKREKGQAAEEAAAQALTVRLRDSDVVKAGMTEFAVTVVDPETAPAPEPQAKPAARKPGGGFTQFLEGLAPLAAGDGPPKVPGYTTDKLLKEGGMGRVYLARRDADGRVVVLKVIKPSIRKPNAEQLKLFKREMGVAKGLEHPNIVRLFEDGEAGGVFYFLMEFCEQGSVAELMARSGGRLPLARAGEIMLDALAGLEHAHAKSIVHRDLKPDNILLAGPKGSAKLADFGLAKNFAMAGMSGMTAVGQSGAGTPPFMPKEQLTDFRATRPASDVFAMGATLYNMLTGEFVYDSIGADPFVAILRGRMVPIAKRSVKLPEAVVAAVDRATAFDFKERYPSAKEFRSALAEALR